MELILTLDDSTSSYAIICYNVRTYQSAGVVVVVKGQQNVIAKVKELEGSQSSTEQHEGWRYIFEKTTLKVGTDPTEATRKRQEDLDARESKAMQETQTPFAPSQNRHRS